VCVLIASVVAELLMKEFVEFKNNRYHIHSTKHSADDDVTRRCHDNDEAPSADRLVVKVSHIPRGLSEQMVQMILENRRYGGGTMKHMEFSESEQSAIVEYEERSGMTDGW